MAKFIERKNGIVVTGMSLGEMGHGKLLFNGFKVFVWKGETVLEVDGDNGCTTM